MRLAAVIFGATCLLLTACAPRKAAEIVDRKVITQAERDEQIGGQLIRVVKRGDTLYGIAFMAGLDIHRLAAWNGISDTSRVQVGQTIRLTKPRGFVERAAKAKPVKARAVAKQSTNKTGQATTEQRKKAAKPTVRVAKTSGGNRKTSTQSNTKSNGKKTVKKAATTKATVPSKTKPSTVSQSAVPQKERWKWPFRGTLVARFNPAKGEQGVRIQGQSGQAVHAASAGEVVYAGDSLKGYGNLIIIKHAAEYLSAYAHNERILVSEGQQIQQGQTIAKLHANPLKKSVAQFQIRHHGNPVDPMRYLP